MRESNRRHCEHKKTDCTLHCTFSPTYDAHPAGNTKVRQKFKTKLKLKTRMWANAQPDGRPAEHRWRPLINAAKFG